MTTPEVASSGDRRVDCLLIGPLDLPFASRLAAARMGGQDGITFRNLLVEGTQIDGRPVGAAALMSSAVESDFEGESISIRDILSPAVLELGSQLLAAGFTIDHVGVASEDRIRAASEGLPAVVAVTTTLYTNSRPVTRIVRWLRRHLPEAHVVVGGPWLFGAVSDPRRTADDPIFTAIGADTFVISPDGGSDLVEIVAAVTKGRAPRCPGTITTVDGRYVDVPASLSVGARNDPEPAVGHAVRWGHFGKAVGSFAFVATARSCPFTCGFCDFIEREGPYSSFPLHSVFTALKAISSETKVKSVVFTDDTLNVPSRRFVELLEYLVVERHDFRWSGFFRCDRADEHMLSLLRPSGCEFLKLGLESGSQRMLDAMGKGASIESYERALAILNELGIPYWCSFLVGYPGETAETVAETRAFIERNDLFTFRVSTWFCSTLTRVYRERKMHGLEGEGYSWSHATMNFREAQAHTEWLARDSNGSTHLPILNIEDALVLTHRGVPWSAIIQFFRAFNCAVAESVNGGGLVECSPEARVGLVEAQRAIAAHGDGLGAAG